MFRQSRLCRVEQRPSDVQFHILTSAERRQSRGRGRNGSRLGHRHEGVDFLGQGEMARCHFYTVTPHLTVSSVKELQLSKLNFCKQKKDFHIS